MATLDEINILEMQPTSDASPKLLEFPADLIQYLPPDATTYMQADDGKYYARAEDHAGLLNEANFQKRADEYIAGGRGRNDPDVAFGGNPAHDPYANISGTGIEAAGRNPEYYDDGTYRQHPDIIRYQNPETANILANSKYLTSEGMASPAYYNPRADLLVMPSNPIMYQDRLIDPKQIEAHEYAHRPDMSRESYDPNSPASIAEHIYIAGEVEKDPVRLEDQRNKHFPDMTDAEFEIYYNGVVEDYESRYPMEKRNGGIASLSHLT
jgi:hypothetical protein